MTTPEEAKSELEAAFSEQVGVAFYKWMDAEDESIGDLVAHTEGTKHMCAKAFLAGAKYAADQNQEKIAQLIKEVN